MMTRKLQERRKFTCCFWIRREIWAGDLLLLELRGRAYRAFSCGAGFGLGCFFVLFLIEVRK